MSEVVTFLSRPPDMTCVKFSVANRAQTESECIRIVWIHRCPPKLQTFIEPSLLPEIQ